MKKINISGDYIRLGSFLKLVGEAETGGQAKELINEGNVEVDGEVCLMRGKKLKDGSRVKINNEEYEVHMSCT